jgi:cell division protein FtsL
MLKINAVLTMILVTLALGLVTSQNKARKIFVELQKQQDDAKQLEVEYGQLQLEQSTWAMRSRVEKIAANNLQMRVPPPARIYLVPPPPAPTGP